MLDKFPVWNQLMVIFINNPVITDTYYALLEHDRVAQISAKTTKMENWLFSFGLNKRIFFLS